MSREGRRGRLRFALWLVATPVLPLGFWWLMSWLDTMTLMAGVAPLREAQFLAAPGATPPIAATGWERRSIPDDWRRSAPGALEGWYRLTFRADASTDRNWAVYLPAIDMNAAAWVNGRFVGDGGRFEEPVARNWNRPLLFTFPASILVAGENTLQLRLKADRVGTGALGPVQVGPSQPLLQAHARREAFDVDVLRIIAICQVVVFLFVAALWMQRRKDTFYGWAALASLAWSLTWPNVLVVEIPVATTAWYWLWYASAGWFTLLASRFAIDFVGDSSPPLNRWILGYGLAGSAALAGFAFLDASWFHAAAAWAWIPLSFLAPSYAVVSVLKAIRRDPDDNEVQILYAGGVILFACGLHDWMVVAGLRSTLEGWYSPYPAPLAQLLVGMVLVRRFVGALGESEAQVGELEERVRQKRAELEQSYERIREVDQSRTLSDERQRIMRDVQDGLGSHLVSTLAMIESQADRRAVDDAVRSALDDLRLMIDSLAPVDGELLPVLGQLRARLQPKLDVAGIRVEWRVEDVAPIADLGPHRVLAILRILNEAIADVLVSADARTITVRTGDAKTAEGQAGVFVEVIGDGSGRLAPGQSMRRRATEIGATLATQSSPAGTTVRLWLAMDRPSGP